MRSKPRATKKKVGRPRGTPKREKVKAIRRARWLVTGAKRIMVITGAGISADSGIPTFRGKGGWWASIPTRELATTKALNRNPRRVWGWYDHRRRLISGAQPNAAHSALALWESQGRRILIVTQNVDDLHERAGSTEIVHIHGSIWRVRCTRDGSIRENRQVPLPIIPPLCECGALLRPDTVLFDEELDLEEVGKVETFLQEGVDLVLVIGTEATFDYIIDWVSRASRAGAKVLEINVKATRLTRLIHARKILGIHLRGKAAEVIPAIAPLGGGSHVLA